MDDATRLVQELQDKLAELDGKIAALQRDMRAEFARHMADRLRGCSDEVSHKVTRAILESIPKFTSLFPDGTADDLDSPPNETSAADPSAWNGRGSPPPVLPHTSGTPPGDAVRSPHEREREFRGVFTPNFLPLLDSSEQRAKSPPTSPPSVAPAPAPAPTPPPLQLAMDENKQGEGPKSAAKFRDDGRPLPVRRMTNISTSSVDSSTSETRVRRSALRRSSSSVRGSPRRVRFEVQGVEVLPSSSPQAPAAPIQDVVEAEAPVMAEQDASAVILQDNSQAYTGTSLLDVEGEEDFYPKPKKVSSTQRLQALTRSPLDGGTAWTVVNAGLDESPKINGSYGPRTTRADAPSASLKSKGTQKAVQISQPGISLPNSRSREDLHTLRSNPAHTNRRTVEEDSDNDAFLSMKARGKKPESSEPRSPISHSSTRRLSSSTIDGSADHSKTSHSRRSPSSVPQHSTIETETSGDEDVESLFDMEDDTDKTPQTKYIPDEEILDETELEKEPGPIHATVRPRPVSSSYAGPSIEHVKPFEASVGSYKGRSLSLAPIKSPRLYKEIAGIRGVHFFVGSVDGRSGAEAADMGSYRATLSGPVGGTPRSFSERLAFEEVMQRHDEDDGGAEDLGEADLPLEELGNKDEVLHRLASNRRQDRVFETIDEDFEPSTEHVERVDDGLETTEDTRHVSA